MKLLHWTLLKTLFLGNFQKKWSLASGNTSSFRLCQPLIKIKIKFPSGQNVEIMIFKCLKTFVFFMFLILKRIIISDNYLPPLSLWLFDFVTPYTFIPPFISGKLAWQQKILEVLSDSPLCHFSRGWWCHDLSPVSLQLRASTIRNLGTHFFMHLITCLCTHSCTSHFVHLK